MTPIEYHVAAHAGEGVSGLRMEDWSVAHQKLALAHRGAGDQ
ncbi:hypothetical protein [Streptomyces sp. NRRL S-646]